MPEPSLLSSNFTVDRSDGVVADGVDMATATITLRSADGGTVSGVPVVLTATGSNNTVNYTMTTGANGAAKGTIVSTRAETKTLSAEFTGASGQVTLTQHPTVGFVPGPASQLSFVSQPDAGVAGVVLAPPFAVLASDGFGNPAAATSVTVDFSGDAGAALLGTVTRTTDAGVAIFADLSVLRAGTYRFVAGIDAGASALSAPVTVFPGAPAVAQSTFTASQLQLLADGVTSTALVVNLKDQYLNPIAGAPLSISAVAPDGGLTLKQPMSTDEAGVGLGSATCSVPQTVSFTANVAGSPFLMPVSVSFTECGPGAMAACYSGAAPTLGVGVCKAGVKTCSALGAWGACMGEVTPAQEVCANGLDEDCNGLTDDVPDVDGDGWTRCDGDCCETASECGVPAAVNPGAFEVIGDGIDGDCDPTTSDLTPPAACSPTTKFNQVSAQDFARAIDICQSTTLNPPLSAKKWGLLSATHLLANGAAPGAAQLSEMTNSQTAVTTLFGTSNVPRKGDTMAVLSTGRARDTNAPGFVAPNTGTNWGRTISFGGASPPLGHYLANHGGALAAGKCGTAVCATGTGAYDSVNVRLYIRVPTNAKAFSYDFKFFSAEYQTYQCTQFNDYFLAMLGSGAPGIPADHNVSFDAMGNPVSVNSGFFEACPGNGKNCGPCPLGVASLAGTGFETNNTGGATGWLTSDVPVVPGELITLEFVLFDVADGTFDTTMLFDNFRWSTIPVSLGTHN